jgi:hypothetical protein
VLDGKKLEVVKARLDELKDSPDLKSAVDELVQFGYFLDQEHCPDAANEVLKVASTAAPALRAQAQKLAERGRQARAKIEAARGAHPAPTGLEPRHGGAGIGIKKH